MLAFQFAISHTPVLNAIPLNEIIYSLFISSDGSCRQFFKEQVQCFSQCIGLFIGTGRRFCTVCSHHEAWGCTGTKERHCMVFMLECSLRKENSWTKILGEQPVTWHLVYLRCTSCCKMFNTSTATKKYVPVQDRPKFYAYGGISPRAKRFGTSVRQLVHHDGGKDLDTKPACLAVLDDDAKLPATNPDPKF